MFIFYVILAAQGMVADAGRAKMCWSRINNPTSRTKVQKKEDLSKLCVLKWKQFEDFRQKKNRNISVDLHKKPVEHIASEVNYWIRNL